MYRGFLLLPSSQRLLSLDITYTITDWLWDINCTMWHVLLCNAPVINCDAAIVWAGYVVCLDISLNIAFQAPPTCGPHMWLHEAEDSQECGQTPNHKLTSNSMRPFVINYLFCDWITVLDHELCTWGDHVTISKVWTHMTDFIAPVHYRLCRWVRMLCLRVDIGKWNCPVMGNSPLTLKKSSPNYTPVGNRSTSP